MIVQNAFENNMVCIDYCDNPYEEEKEPVFKRCQACDHWTDVEEMTDGYCKECWNTEE